MFEIKQNNEYVNEHREKLTRIANELHIITKKVPAERFNELTDNMSDRLRDFWSLVSRAIFTCYMCGENWWDVARWDNIIKDYDETITEFTNMFKEAFPELF